MTMYIHIFGTSLQVGVSSSFLGNIHVTVKYLMTQILLKNRTLHVIYTAYTATPYNSLELQLATYVNAK